MVRQRTRIRRQRPMLNNTKKSRKLQASDRREAGTTMHVLAREELREIVSRLALGDRPGVAFARIPDYRPPTWPDGERPQYRHFDVRVDDLELAGASVLELGATPLTDGGETFRVYADPAGHPFCLVVLSASR